MAGYEVEGKIMTSMREEYIEMTEEPHRHLSEIDIGDSLGQGSTITTSVPVIKMVNVSDLFVDFRYQRIITAEGRANIQHIIENFDWMHFQPLLVSPIDEDEGHTLYTVIDGQHRALAAINHKDIQEVPCAVVEIPPEKQAHVFAEINSRQIKVNRLEIFWARYASGTDRKAKEMFDLVDRCGFRIARRMPFPSETSRFNGGHSKPNDLRFDGLVYNLGGLAQVINWHKAGGAERALKLCYEWAGDNTMALNDWPLKVVSKFLHNNFRLKAVPDTLAIHMLREMPWTSLSKKYYDEEYRRPKPMKLEKYALQELERWYELRPN